MSVRRVGDDIIFSPPEKYVVDDGFCSLCGNKKKKKTKNKNDSIVDTVGMFLNDDYDGICTSCNSSIYRILKQNTEEHIGSYNYMPELYRGYSGLISPEMYDIYIEAEKIADEEIMRNEYGFEHYPKDIEEELNRISELCEYSNIHSLNYDVYYGDSAEASLRQYKYKELLENEESLEMVATQFVVNLLNRERSEKQRVEKYGHLLNFK